MNRDDLRGLGIEENLVNAVMALHGSAINAINDKVTTLETEKTQLQEQIEQRDTQLDELKNSSDDSDFKQRIEELETSNTELKENHETEIEQLKREHQIEMAIVGAKAKNTKAVRALIDDASITIEDGELKGLDEAIKALQESDAYLFDVAEQPKPKAWSQGGVSTVQSGAMTKKDILAIEDPREREQAVADNLHLFRT